MDDPGHAALAALDKVLEERPNKVGHDFSATTRLVVTYRDGLAAIWRQTRAESDRQRLARANAVLSVVVGGHFPLGPVPWDIIEKGRDELAGLVGEAG